MSARALGLDGTHGRRGSSSGQGCEARQAGSCFGALCPATPSKEPAAYLAESRQISSVGVLGARDTIQPCPQLRAHSHCTPTLVRIEVERAVLAQKHRRRRLDHLNRVCQGTLVACPAVRAQPPR